MLTECSQIHETLNPVNQKVTRAFTISFFFFFYLFYLEKLDMYCLQMDSV